MTQVFVVGASITYGVGASEAGWADLIKRYFHSKMYSSGGVGEEYEVFNFSKSGTPIDFVLESYPTWIKEYYRKDKLVIVFSLGINDSKATDQPTNFFSSPDKYSEQLRKLIGMFKSDTNQIFGVGNAYVDEPKTTPKSNPFTGSKSFFTNERIRLFDKTTADVSTASGVDFTEIDVDKERWIKDCLYSDGLHPNQTGHQLIFESIKPKLDNI